MLELNFNIPLHFRDPDEVNLDFSSKAVHHWCATLPLANVAESAEKLLGLQRNLNSINILPGHRMEVQEILQPIVEDISEALIKLYGSARLPLHGRYLRAFELTQQINNEAMRGFRITASSINRHKDQYDNANNIFMTALFMCVHHMSLIMLGNYTVYFPVPPFLWNAIHQIYHCAEARGAHNIPINKINDNGPPRTISMEYKRMILMALANPYHLMQEECVSVYHELKSLALECNLFNPKENHMKGSFLIDLQADASPRYVPDPDKQEGIDIRILDISPLLKTVKDKLIKLQKLAAENRDKGIERLKLRMQIDMYERLLSSWGRQGERQHERVSKLDKIMIAMGLSTTHFFASSEQEFKPEIDEIRITTGKALDQEAGSDSGLSLLPQEYEPWRLEDDTQRIRTGIASPRSSNFDDQSKARDIWHKVYHSRSEEDEEVSINRDISALFETNTWQQKNESLGGLCLFCTGSDCTQAKVGELVGYRHQATNDNWTIGAVRWMHVLNNDTLELGIMRIIDDVRPVATRSIAGAGQGGDYFRALITASHPVNDPQTRLIVPAAIYDIDTKILLNMGDSLEYIQLTDIYFSTKSFSTFSFKVIGRPESEDKMIEKLNRML
jgi:hypothetical protein